MIEETIKRIEERVQKAPAMKAENRAAVLGLIDQLKGELHEVAKRELDQARSVAGFAELSAHEATKEHANEGLLAIALDGLKRSVEGFEDSHPKLVQVINSISTSLSNLGI